MACGTANAFDLVCRLDRDGKLDEVPQDKKQKVATGLLLDKLHEQDFAGPLSLRASKVLGPISRCRVADISVGCPNEPDSLSHYNECPRLYNTFI